MKRFSALIACVWITLLASCAGTGPAATNGTAGKPGGSAAVATAPALGLFSKIKAPSTHEPTLQLAARGVQIFRCERRDAELTWIFRQPQAELLDSAGQVVGQHGASFSFEHEDGSRLIATVAAYDEAPKTADLRWLLFTTRSFGKGAFENITHVQRINTTGGVPPGRCQAPQLNQLLRIDFTSDFVFYRPRPE